MAQFLVDFTRAAEREIEEIEEWLAADSVEAAGRWMDGLLAVVDRLERMPARYPLAPENESHAEEIRQLIYGRYRVLFTIFPGRVLVLHVRHGARLPLRGKWELTHPSVASMWLSAAGAVAAYSAIRESDGRLEAGSEGKTAGDREGQRRHAGRATTG